VTVDLSKEAIAARQKAKARTQRDGGWTGRELTSIAADALQEANRLAKVTMSRPPGRRRDRASAKADQMLMQAAAQIRIAQLCPFDRGYLHALDLEQIQRVKDQVARAFQTDPGVLAVDTHRRVQDQRNRIRGGHT
jgi:hypothetical protein